MKKFFKHLMMVMGIVLTGMIVFDVIYAYVYEHGEPRNKTEYILNLKNKRIDYVFLGSSRVENHISTKLVEERTGKKALNLGVQGATLDDAFLLLKIMVHNNITTEKVFLQVDDSYNIEDPSIIVGTESLPYIRSNKIIRQHRKDNNDYNLNYYVPFYRYSKNDYKIGFREFIGSLVGKKIHINFSDGFDPIDQKFKTTEYMLPGTIKNENGVLSAISLFCKQNSIEMVYFCAPYCSEIGNIDYVTKLKERVPDLVDFSQSMTNTIYFKDCGHLNEKGALLFTEKLIETCL